MTKELIKRIRACRWFVTKISGGYMLTKGYSKKTIEIRLIRTSGGNFFIEDNAIKYVFNNRISHFISKEKERRNASNKLSIGGFLKMAAMTGLISKLVDKHPFKVNPLNERIDSVERGLELDAYSRGLNFKPEEG